MTLPRSPKLFLGLGALAAASACAGAALLATVATSGCGDDTCVIITTGGTHQALSEWTVTFAVTDASQIGALQADVVSDDCDGDFTGRADQLDCQPLVDAIFAGNHIGERSAKFALIDLDGFRTPAAIVACGYRSRGEPTAANFRIVVTDASDTNSSPLENTPNLVVASVTPR